MKTEKKKADEIAYDRVASMLEVGMWQGNMHTCLRGAGRLAGGFLATGTLRTADVENLKTLAVARSIDKKLGARTFDGGIEEGRKSPLTVEMNRPEESQKFGLNDALPRPQGRSRRVDQPYYDLDAPLSDGGPQYGRAGGAPQIVDQSWLEAAELPPPPSADGWQAEEFKRYLRNMFKPEERVCVNINVYKHETETGEVFYTPQEGDWDHTAGELIALADKKKGDLGAFLGDHKKAAGAWVRINPVDGKGGKDANVVAFRHVLLEADEGDLAKQLGIIRKLDVPCSTIVHSGGKSIHALVRVEAPSMDEYRKRVEYLYSIAKANGLKVDEKCKNPSRLSRLPGYTRGDKKQYTICDKCGLESWDEWVEWIEDQKDDLPQITSLGDIDFDNPPPLDPELIHGILRRGRKLLLTGPSKAGKTWDLLQLCAAFASGGMWHGWQCEQGKVLYVNLELHESEYTHRMIKIFRAHNIDFANRDRIDCWHLKGKAKSLDLLAPKLIRRARKMGYAAIVIDPIYKVLTGDENSAAAMGAFTNLFDTISVKLGCAVICCHHHSKGAQGQKKAGDRASGSGVFTRDPDAILDMIELIVTPAMRKQLRRTLGAKALADAARAVNLDVEELYGQDEAGDPDALFMKLTVDYPAHADQFREALANANAAVDVMSAWRIESTLREFAKPPNAVCWFRQPIHETDKTGILSEAKAEGEEPYWQVEQREKQAAKKERKRLEAAEKASRKDAGSEEPQEQQRAKEQDHTDQHEDGYRNDDFQLLEAAIEATGGVGVATLVDLTRSIKRPKSSARTIRRIAKDAGYYFLSNVIYKVQPPATEAGGYDL